MEVISIQTIRMELIRDAIPQVSTAQTMNWKKVVVFTSLPSEDNTS